MPYGTTAYDWAGAGRRDWLMDVSTTCNITNGPISNLVDGNKANNNADGVFCNAAESGREFKFKWPWPVKIDEFKWIQDAAGTQGTWKLAGSDDDVTYTDIVTGLDLGGAAAIDTHSFTNTNGYTYYKLIQTAGTTTTSRWIQEVEFKVARDTNFATGVAGGPTSYSALDGSGNRKTRMLALLSVNSACGSTDMTALLDGSTTSGSCSTSTAFSGGGSGLTIKFGFRTPLVIDEFTWIQQLVAAHGTWKISGSKDDVTYVDLGTGIALGAGSTSEAFPFVNTEGYNFYKLTQTSGTVSATPWLNEINFKTAELIAGGGGSGGGSQPVVIIIQ